MSDQPLRALAEQLRPRIDDLYDPATHLVWNPPGSLDDEGVPGRTLHQVPQSAWFALDVAARALHPGHALGALGAGPHRATAAPDARTGNFGAGRQSSTFRQPCPGALDRGTDARHARTADRALTG